jgi:hypothetical protein
VREEGECVWGREMSTIHSCHSLRIVTGVEFRGRGVRRR